MIHKSINQTPWSSFHLQHPPTKQKPYLVKPPKQTPSHLNKSNSLTSNPSPALHPQNPPPKRKTQIRKTPQNISPLPHQIKITNPNRSQHKPHHLPKPNTKTTKTHQPAVLSRSKDYESESHFSPIPTTQNPINKERRKKENGHSKERERENIQGKKRQWDLL